VEIDGIESMWIWGPEQQRTVLQIWARLASRQAGPQGALLYAPYYSARWEASWGFAGSGWQGRPANRKRHGPTAGSVGERWLPDADGEVSTAHWAVGLREHVPVRAHPMGRGRVPGRTVSFACGRTAGSVRAGRRTARTSTPRTDASAAAGPLRTGRPGPSCRPRAVRRWPVFRNRLARVGSRKARSSSRCGAGGN
jgi:hypothetical protein